MYFSHVFVWNQNRACEPLHRKAENSWKRRIQASKFITKHARIGRTYLRWKRIKSRVYMPANTPTRPLHWREPHREFVALDFEALDVKIALDFRAFVLQSCTLYTVKKNEALNRRPHFVSRNPLLITGPDMGNESAVKRMACKAHAWSNTTSNILGVAFTGQMPSYFK